MTKNPLVSVIIPLHNREKTIGRAIDSVLQQTYSHVEIIIVDDCSIDNSLEVVGNYSNDNLKVIRLSENHGASYARNIGIQNSSGELVAFLDSDDEWCKYKLETQIGYMQVNMLEACFCSYTQISRSGVRKQIPDKVLYPYEIIESNICKILSYTNIVGTPALIISREVIDDVGLFDVSLPKLEDYDYAIRLVQKYKLGFISEPLLYAYIQADSLTIQKYDALAFLIMLRKHFEFIDKVAWIKKFIDLGYFIEMDKIDYQRMDEVEGLTGLDIKKMMLDAYTSEWLAKLSIQKIQYEAFIKTLQNQEFIIYGAGICGKMVFEELFEMGLKPKAFAVTRIENNIQDVNGIPLVELSNIADKKMNMIVATTSKYALEMVNALMEKGFTSFIVYPTQLT